MTFGWYAVAHISQSHYRFREIVKEEVFDENDTCALLCITALFSSSYTAYLSVSFAVYFRSSYTGLVICSWAVLLSILITIWCTFDAAGRSWVKMKKYQRSMRESESRFNYKRSGSMNRNWRQRSVNLIFKHP